MTDKCFEIGTIQAFLDGELETASLEMVARHVSVCENCAALLAEAEEESALAFTALDGELNYLVPTERIRTNLYEAIAAEKKPFWKRIFGGNFSLINPSVAAFASLFLVAAVFTTLFILRGTRLNTPEIARKETTKPNAAQNASTANQTPDVSPAREAENESANPPIAPTAVKTNVRPVVENRALIQNADYRIRKAPVKNQTPDNAGITPTGSVEQTPKNQGLVGEQSYIKTIATLTDTVNSRKDAALKPSARISFEKDLAVVDDAIIKMRKEVRKDPKNEAAKELLRNSYQNKIDLLNSVADKGELMATLK